MRPGRKIPYVSPAEGEEEEPGLIVKAFTWERPDGVSVRVYCLLLWVKKPLVEIKKKKKKKVILATKTGAWAYLLRWNSFAQKNRSYCLRSQVADVFS